MIRLPPRSTRTDTPFPYTTLFRSTAIAEPLDPQLDADVKSWFDEDCRLPRLQLLGPVRAQAHGDPAAVSRRKPHYVEMLTFLVLHPEGVTTKQIAEAFSVNKDRVRVDITMVRKWLGRNERTGQPQDRKSTRLNSSH